LPIVEIETVLNHLARNFTLEEGGELTLEANPGTLSLPYLKDLRKSGLNRISLGMQSASPEQLRFLERQHTTYDTIAAVKWARQAGFDNLNLDLIFGLPGQSLAGWLESLSQAMELRPEHLSLYALTVEKGTPLHHWYGRGLVTLTDDDLVADQYEAASERLAERGYEQYEISNWALGRDGGASYACRHNLQYWRGLPYIGMGAGAHGYYGHLRIANVLSPQAYIKRLTVEAGQAAGDSARIGGKSSFPVTPAAVEVHLLDQTTEKGEFMFMGLRLVKEGIAKSTFQERFGMDLLDAYPDPIQRLLRAGLIEWAGSGNERLRLTQKGRFLSNQVFVEFI
jgi:oxygen-independent coproporphyrinogen-3 oxidase